MHQCHSQCKTISTLKLANMNLLLLYLLNNMQLNIQSHKGESKKFQISVIFEFKISWLLSSLDLCNQQSLILRETQILALQNCFYFEHLIAQIQKSSKCFKM